MRTLLLLALLLYDIVATVTRSANYDYDDIEGNKRHSFMNDRRSWRKNSLMKPQEILNRKEWEDRRRHEYDNQRYMEELEAKYPADNDGYNKHLDDIDRQGMANARKSMEMGPMGYMDKDPEKKFGPMNCEQPHERYETCFAGCASVTCDNPRDRLRPCYPFCEQGCVCVSPYVRDDRTHKCVLPDECTRGLKGIPDLGDET